MQGVYDTVSVSKDTAPVKGISAQREFGRSDDRARSHPAAQRGEKPPASPHPQVSLEPLSLLMISQQNN